MQAKQTPASPKPPRVLTEVPFIYGHHRHKACTGVSSPLGLCELNYQTDSLYKNGRKMYLCQLDFGV